MKIQQYIALFSMFVFFDFFPFSRNKYNRQIQRMLNIIECYKALTTVTLEGFESIITKYKVEYFSGGEAHMSISS